MATVRFSDELKRDIRSNAEKMFDAKLEKADAAVPVSFNPTTIYELMFKDHLAEMSVMPKGYFNKDNDFTIAGIRGKGVPDDMDIRPFRLDMGRDRPWPMSMDSRVHGLVTDRRGSYGTMTLNANDDRWSPELVADYVTYCTAYNNVMDSRKAFVSGVDAVINTFATLAPALKEWPALWDLLPDRTKERHKEIVERKKRVVSVNSDAGHHETVDLDSLTAAVVVSKLTR